MTPVLPTGRIGVYVHVPFCRRHCPYCDFAVVVTARVPRDAYLDRLLRELESRASSAEGRELATLYFGGGTPTLWGAGAIGRVVHAVGAAFGRSPVEITVEANPEDITPALLDGLLDAGVTRLSLGVQSFDEATLAVLGRGHGGAQAHAAVRDAASAGFAHVSLDLIYAVPGEPGDRIDRDLAAVADLGGGVDHVSAYELTFEPRTALSARAARGLFAEPGDDTKAEAGRVVVEGLRAMGFHRYEVSNFARPSGESVHNASYWRGDEYLGLGVGAHSLELAGACAVRSATGRAIRDYLAGRGAREEERLPAATHVAELVMLGARTCRGVDFSDLEARTSASVVAPFRRLAAVWERRGWGVSTASVFRPFEATLDFADVLGLESVALADSTVL